MSVKSNQFEKTEADFTLGIIDTNVDSVDIHLECNSGHLAIFEFEGLMKLSVQYDSVFIDTFQQRVTQDMAEAIHSWGDGGVMTAKSCWVGRSLLLVGFPQSMEKEVFDRRISTLALALGKPRNLGHVDSDDPSSDLRLSRVNVICSGLTRPKLVSHVEMSTALINKLQEQKLRNLRGAVEFADGKPSARWYYASALAANVNVGSEGDSHTTSRSYVETTRRALRKQFTEGNLDLRAVPTVNPVTGCWVSLSVWSSGLNESLESSEIRNGDTLSAVCKELAMGWELEAATINQTLCELSDSASDGRHTETGGTFPIKLPVSLESLLNWSYFKDDLEGALKGFDYQVTNRLILIIDSLDDSKVEISAAQMKRLAEWMPRLTEVYGIEFMAHFNNLDAFNPKGLHNWLPISGIVFSDTSSSPALHNIIHAMMRQDERTDPPIPLTLDATFSENARRVASEIGVEFIEEPFNGEPKGLQLKTALPLAHGLSLNSTRHRVIDARSRFRHHDVETTNSNG